VTDRQMMASNALHG